jgi:NADH-quinone oxidoreductase subunit G
LIVGPDFYTHPNAKNLARLVALVEKYTEFKLTMIPPLSNSLGVALICELDDTKGKFTIGYNTKGDFTLSALGDGDLDMPAINQQEGTLTSINKRVNPTNAALPYHGYELNDIANALGFSAQHVIEYTASLPLSSGFKAQKFDCLPNHYENDGTEVRGYLLDTVEISTGKDEIVAPISDKKLSGTLIYLANPVRQFSEFTNKTTALHEEAGIYMSADFLAKSDLNEGDSVKIKSDTGELVLKIISDNKISGDIACLPTFDSKINSEALFGSYRFATASIKKV